MKYDTPGYQHVSKIEKMKNQWADSGISPYQFYTRFYRIYSHQPYPDFLEMINVFGKYTPELEKAVNDFNR